MLSQMVYRYHVTCWLVHYIWCCSNDCHSQQHKVTCQHRQSVSVLFSALLACSSHAQLAVNVLVLEVDHIENLHSSFMQKFHLSSGIVVTWQIEKHWILPTFHIKVIWMALKEFINAKLNCRYHLPSSPYWSTYHRKMVISWKEDICKKWLEGWSGRY